MFDIVTRKRLIEQLRHPLRQRELRNRINDLMIGTRYKNAATFANALEKEDVIQTHIVKAENGMAITLYCSVPLTDVDPYELARSLFPSGYFCNLSAIYHHSLTDQIPNNIYWCHETVVPRKTKASSKISDSQIRNAFIKPRRHTKFVIKHNGYEITIISRNIVADYGIDTIKHNKSICPIEYRVTCLERALIDAVVSPQYNGGITSLCEYFRIAGESINIARLLEIYRKMDFVYPYAQPLGFFFENTGFVAYAKEVRDTYPPKHNFFVDHDAKTSWIFDNRWMLYYPKGLV